MQGITIAAFFLSLGLYAKPDHATYGVHDFAHTIEPDVEQRLEELTQTVERDTTAQVAIVTVPTLNGSSIDSYATELFNHWGIGRADLNNGVLFLWAPNERKVRIEVGYGLEPLLTDSICGDILDEQVIPKFKYDAFGAGLLLGAERISDILHQFPEAARGQPGSAPIWVRTQRTETGYTLLAVALWAAIILFIFPRIVRLTRWYPEVPFLLVCGVSTIAALRAAYLTWLSLETPSAWYFYGFLVSGGALGIAMLGDVDRYMRYRARACPQCGSREILLSEQAEDQKLTAMQQLEERIGSVDYDVWFCPACLKKNVESDQKGDFVDCAKCQARTGRKVSETTIVEATTDSMGILETDYRCMSCQTSFTERTEIPELSIDSSSSSSSSGGGGSSSGGGSSGGGGASRSY